ncbi:MAG TPA: hypothetical protein DEB06_06025 [Phycisphaerales bacterium]|nr:hypothetical protein [Phycisphaerales bacterium]
MATPSDPSIFDRALFMENTMDDVELIHDLVQSLEQSWPPSEADLQAAIAAGDPAHLDRAAHRIKGAVSAFFAGKARETAAQLEALGRGGSVTGAAAMFEKLQKEMAELLAALKAL